jgi:poly(A) polymerase
MKVARRIAAPGWMRRPPVRRILGALAAAGGTGRFVGGAVRAALLREARADIDLATDLPPGAVMRALRRAHIQAIPTGLRHGTITARLGGVTMEVTTLRVDVETDGRHARVAFTDDWAADAARRDFTINALYADADGAIYDPLGGLPDLMARRVRFIGRAADRISEDALRILRFFRFHARYAAGPPDATALAACAAAGPLLERLSGERLAVETLKLLSAVDPQPALDAMDEAGLLARYLPPPFDLDRAARLVAVERRWNRVDALRRLAALLPHDVAAARAAALRLRLSTAMRQRLVHLAKAPPPLDTPAAVRRAIDRHGGDLVVDFALMGEADGRLVSAGPALELAATWAPPRFPLGGADVAAMGVQPGPATGELLRQVRAWWVDGDFVADAAACRAHLRTLV